MNKIPCEVARDLFPSYIDGLTSDVTNQVVEEHLEGCEACREVLQSMKEKGSAESLAAEFKEPERKEIDFLKKNKRRNLRIVLGSIAGALVLILAVLFIRFCLIGDGQDTDWTAVGIEVQGENLSLAATSRNMANTIHKLNFTEEDGIVTVTARTALATPFFPYNTCYGTYTADEEIREVRVGDRIVWSHGATVSAPASDLFAARHSYIGDMPANNDLAQALSLASFLGPFTNELETDKEPYGWKILLSDAITEDSLPQREQDMEAFGYVIVGLIQNLDHVTFLYHVDSKELEKTITAADATAFFGKDIKTCGTDIHALDELIKKTGLSLYTIEAGGTHAEETTSVRILNQTDLEIYSILMDFYINGENVSSGGQINADQSPHMPGDTFWVTISPSEFGLRTDDPSEMDPTALYEVEFSFETMDGTVIEIPERFRVTANAAMIYDFILTETEDGSYVLTQ